MVDVKQDVVAWIVDRGSWFVVCGSWFVDRGSWFVVRGWWFERKQDTKLLLIGEPTTGIIVTRSHERVKAPALRWCLLPFSGVQGNLMKLLTADVSVRTMKRSGNLCVHSPSTAQPFLFGEKW